ncbi:PTS lactose/cellobiose transporter subunit IIA [Lactiplantibacillus nangangensis]|uniref:PTS lactose/cellobiose transporter subunit IIA n=1 Tax=Lactiplantibacillus nangangensis TaxID=2559917 RepID=A0ABW1SH06_9LACO|nr:PTS lactose/cellobiose transporter subunit IIA [Lactiplantibacillus nangangensis]
MEEYNSEAQNIAMQIIAYSGEGRTLAFQALNAAQAGNFIEAQKLLKESEVAIGQAHDVQTELLVAEANGEQTPFSILLIHSQDHFMTSMLAGELIKEMIRMSKNQNGGN